MPSGPQTSVAWIRLSVSAALIAACGAPASPADSAPGESGATSNASGAIGEAGSEPSSATPSPTSSIQDVSPALPVSDVLQAERFFDEPALSLAPGRAGRLAVIADEAGRAVPWRFEGGAWKRLELPEAERVATSGLVAGMYFGRDDRPRLMGYAAGPSGLRMIYLRYKDVGWRGEPSEIGRLAKAPAAELFGVLGWDDPEVVCKKGDVCLIKSRQGWKEVPPTLPPTAVVRAFGGRGYALTADGLFRADEGGFTRLGPAAPWRTEATGFWIGADGSAVVTEPAADALHVLAAGGAWTKVASPIDAPSDVAGPDGNRFVVGAGGIAHEEQGSFRRVGEASWRISFVIEVEGGAVAAGPSGVVRIAKTVGEAGAKPSSVKE